MGRRKKQEDQKKTLPPAISDEQRESRAVSLAFDLAEKMLMEGTASSQIITHFLQRGSSKDKLEKEILERKKDLITAKTESLESSRRYEEIYAEAISAMKRYQGMEEIVIDDED